MPGKIVVTAQRKPVFEILEIKISDLLKDRREILGCFNEFLDLRKKIYDVLTSLPEIPPSERLPIDLMLMVQIQNQPNA